MLEFMDTVNERIYLIVKEMFNGNVSAFCRVVGIKQPTLNTIVGSRKSKPSYDVLNAIATSDLNLNTDWLITGRGSMTKDDSTTEPFAILQKYDAEVEIKNEIITIKRKHK